MECIKLMRVFLHWKSIFIVLILMILILFINESLNVNVFDLLLDQFTTTKSKIESIGMSGESWRTYNNLHETSVSIQHKDCNTCHDFFGLWPSDCVDNYDSLVDKIKTISTQMVAMSANFTLMTTSPNKCTFKYPNINTLVFNTTEILLECGFESAISKIDSWKKSRFTRMSDILRICLASKYRMAYMDTDVHYLHLNKTLFECTYAGAQMWGNYRNAIEITNSAFCLPPAILHDMSRYQLNRIVRGGDNYFYTELGPSMFHNVSNSYVYFIHILLHIFCMN